MSAFWADIHVVLLIFPFINLLYYNYKHRHVHYWWQQSLICNGRRFDYAILNVIFPNSQWLTEYSFINLYRYLTVKLNRRNLVTSCLWRVWSNNLHRHSYFLPLLEPNVLFFLFLFLCEQNWQRKESEIGCIYCRKTLPGGIQQMCSYHDFQFDRLGF